MAREADLRQAGKSEKGHARLETRQIETLSKLPEGVNFPGAKQICRLTRQRTIDDKTSIEIVLALTSLTRLRANAKALLKLSRQHWSIENRVHYVRDVAFGEDACTVSSGHAPQLLAALRNASLFLLRAAKWKSIARATRRLTAKPAEAIRIVTGARSTNF